MNPSYQHYATHDESEYPELWEGCVGAWAPCLGPSGTRLHDNSGRANWGTLTNMDAATDWVVDGGRHALDFDGSNDTVNAGTSPGLSTPGEMTFSLWVRPVSAAGVDVVAANSNIGVTEVQWALEFNRAANKFSILANASTVALTSTTAITQGNWYHVMFTRSGATGSWVYRFFLNGRQDGEATTIQNPGNHSTVALGSYGAFATSFTFRGMIDDARLYIRPLAISEGVMLASSRGIAYTPRRRRKAYSLAPSFNAAWARGANQFIQPSMIGVA